MIISINLKSDLPNITGRYGDVVYCNENGLFYKISSITNRPIIGDKTTVTTLVESTPPTSTSYSEVGTIRVDSTTNKIYVCSNNSDTENIVWKDISVDETNLIPRVTSTSNPTLTDSSYKVGTIWINTVNDIIFILVDNTENNAVWNEYNKKHAVVSETIILNSENMNTKTISLSNVTSNTIFTFQYTGNIQEYVIADIKLSVIEIVENTSVTVMAFTPNRYNGNITFKIIIN